MALLISLGALAFFVPSAFAQSSGYFNASATNVTATGVPYLPFNTVMSYGPTATPAPSGLTTSYIDVSAIGPASAGSSSFITSSIGNPASTLQSAEGSCDQVTVTETAYQTVSVAATPTISQEEESPTITVASVSVELSRNTHTHTREATNYLTHTLVHANTTGLHGKSPNGARTALPTGVRLDKVKSHRRGRFAGR